MVNEMSEVSKQVGYDVLKVNNDQILPVSATDCDNYCHTKMGCNKFIVK